jgi:ubiquinone/menaquinone biosynthesis C-methylase UbiE
VLEVGCGVGAQTVTLARQSPGARIIAMDISGEVYSMTFGPGAFDHVFACFVLEHLSRPRDTLAHLHQILQPDGTFC